MGAVSLHLKVLPDQLAAVDRFIAEEAPGISRPEAVRRLMVEALQHMGLFPTGRSSDRQT